MGNGNETNAEGGEGNPPVSLGPTAFNLVGYTSIQPINSPSQEPISPGGFTAIPLHQKWPSVQQFSFGIQHEFPGGNLLGVSYVGSLGTPPGDGTQSQPGAAGRLGPSTFRRWPTRRAATRRATAISKPSLIGPGGNPAVFFSPYIGYTGITGKQNTAVSSYNSLQVSFRHDVGHGLTFEAAYTWSHAIDNSTTTYFSTGVDDNYNFALESDFGLEPRPSRGDELCLRVAVFQERRQRV